MPTGSSHKAKLSSSSPVLTSFSPPHRQHPQHLQGAKGGKKVLEAKEGLQQAPPRTCTVAEPMGNTPVGISLFHLLFKDIHLLFKDISF